MIEDVLLRRKRSHAVAQKEEGLRRLLLFGDACESGHVFDQ
jgi:hypothetical protein